MRGRGIFIWAVVRLPALALLVYLLRHPILNAIERQFDIFHVTRFAIDVLSTPVARLVLCATFFGVLLLVMAACARRLHILAAYALLLIAAGSLIAVLCTLTATSLKRGLLVSVILSVNLAPGPYLRMPTRFRSLWNALMLAGVGVAELFFAREYYHWVRCQIRGETGDDCGVHWGVAAAIPGLLLTSIAFALVIRGEKLVAFEQTIRMPAEVQVLERRLSFNWIELDQSGRYLYATGHDLRHLRRYDVGDGSAPPITSDVSTGGSQGFAYDPHANEIYAINTFTNQLLFFDAATLEARRTLALPQLSPGDPWVVVDPISDTLTVVSEADQKVGVPFVVLDRVTGRVREQADLDAGNVLMHPTKPWVYLSFFRRRNQVMLYDLESRMVTRRAPADARAERMAFWAEANEVLVTSPMESRILRVDADDLHPKGYIPAPFGARAIALDERRRLLLCGNIGTGLVVVIDLRTGKQLRSYYLGPWLRTIALHVESGTAYVSSNGALYRLSYASPILHSP